MSTAIWGPPIWNLFHTLAAKIREDRYDDLGQHLFRYIAKISMYLPCPQCSAHATAFFSKINPANLKTKNDLVNTIYILHNLVNKRKEKAMYGPRVLEQYKNKNIIHAYNYFANVYKTKGNMKLMTDTFQRQLIVGEFKKWLMANITAFF
jgi:hypothetical protein